MVEIFISFKDNASDDREGFEGLLQNPNANLNHTPVSAREDYRKQGKIAVKSYLTDLIMDSDALVCLVGQDTHSSWWVNFELQVASSLRIGLVALRIPDTTGGRPQLLKSKGIPETEWDRDEITRAINNAIQNTRQHQGL